MLFRRDKRGGVWNRPRHKEQVNLGPDQGNHITYVFKRCAKAFWHQILLVRNIGRIKTIDIFTSYE